ncbi:MAG: hypothetical protein V9G98_01495 [Candidatus Competibacter sp.]
MSIQIGALGSQSARKRDIVGVHTGDVAPTGKRQTEIQSMRETPALTSDGKQAIVQGSVFRKHRRGCIVAAIVDGDDLEVDPLLGDHAIQCLGQKAFAVSYR